MLFYCSFGGNQKVPISFIQFYSQNNRPKAWKDSINPHKNYIEKKEHTEKGQIKSCFFLIHPMIQTYINSKCLECLWEYSDENRWTQTVLLYWLSTFHIFYSYLFLFDVSISPPNSAFFCSSNLTIVYMCDI